MIQNVNYYIRKYIVEIVFTMIKKNIKQNR